MLKTGIRDRTNRAVVIVFVCANRIVVKQQRLIIESLCAFGQLVRIAQKLVAPPRLKAEFIVPRNFGA